MAGDSNAMRLNPVRWAIYNYFIREINMLKIVTILDWKLEIDREITEKIYIARNIEEDCQCLLCKNYRSATKDIPQEILNIMDILGVNPSKPIEAIQYAENNDGSRFYSGIYNVIGRIVSGDDYLQSNNFSKNGAMKHIEMKHIDKNVSVGFSKNSYYPKGFPDPVFQFEFMANLPWRLKEKPE
jgi:hypothetical protein